MIESLSSDIAIAEMHAIMRSINDWEDEQLSGWFRIEYCKIVDTLLCDVSLLYNTSGFFHTERAVIDTGSTISAVSSRVAEQMGLVPTCRLPYYGTDGKSASDVCSVNMHLPGGIVKNAVHVWVLPKLKEDTDIIIGMNVLKLGNLMIDTSTYQTILTFVTNTKHCDYKGFDPNMAYFTRELPYGIEYSSMERRTDSI